MTNAAKWEIIVWILVLTHHCSLDAGPQGVVSMVHWVMIVVEATVLAVAIVVAVGALRPSLTVALVALRGTF